MLRVAASPPDEDHPYGFSKAEYFSAGIEGGLIVFAAAGILVASLPRLLHPQPLDLPVLGLALTALATLLNFAVARSLIGAGRRFHSITLEADGRHLMTDVWTSAGVFAGVALTFATGAYWLDPLVALAVAAHIVWAGATLVRRSIRGLLDAAISPLDKGEV